LTAEKRVGVSSGLSLGTKPGKARQPKKEGIRVSEPSNVRGRKICEHPKKFVTPSEKPKERCHIKSRYSSVDQQEKNKIRSGGFSGHFSLCIKED